MKKTVVISALLTLLIQGFTARGQNFHLLPEPNYMTTKEGVYFVADRVELFGDVPEFSVINELQKATPKKKTDKRTRRIMYIFDKFVLDEGYWLSVEDTLVTIGSATTSGFLYAEQTIMQLRQEGAFMKLPGLEIIDSPRFGWRGMHLDESRHFMGKEFVLKYIDWLFSLKMNVLHWHLTDAPGWRIEIKKYPKLTEVGAWRPDRSGLSFMEADTAKAGEAMTYGGYYTQKDIKEIVRYAAERNITIIPEIEMPGHTTAALVAYPEYSCTGGPFPMPGGAKNSPYPNFCVGNEDTYVFLADILSEIAELFPSEYIHIGGDEVERSQWSRCSKCQKLKGDLKIEDDSKLQVYFTERIEEILAGMGRKLMGWDEIMEGETLTPSAGVMVWRGEDLVKRATSAGHQVVVTHNYYFDLYQGSPALEPMTYGYLPLERVYTYEPVPAGSTDMERANIRGVQGCLWTEMIPDKPKAEYMLFPRILALAEVGWTQPEKKDWKRFVSSLPRYLKRLDEQQINYATSIFDPEVKLVPEGGVMTCQFSQQIPQGDIRYTLDGSEPGSGSPVYTGPVRLRGKAEIRAKAFYASGKESKTSAASYQPTLSTGKQFSLKNQPAKQYNGDRPWILNDGVKGSVSFNDGNWCGFYGDDVEFTLDLGEKQEIKSLRTNFYAQERSWIYLPEAIMVEKSDDGENWTTIASNPGPAADGTEGIKTINLVFEGVKTRFLRVKARNKGQHPIYPDGKCWIFMDEIELNQ
ncbi:MAG: family 20 glycosylhydrolase [Bacteroidota bacterium]